MLIGRLNEITRQGFILISLLVFSVSILHAQTEQVDSCSKLQIRQDVSIYYHHDQVTLDTTYLENTTQMKDAIRFLELAPKIDSITIVAYASPEGNVKYNTMLAKKRAETAKAFILDNLPDKYGEGEEPHITLQPMGENWEGLYRAVVNDQHQPDKEQVLAILEDTLIGSSDRKLKLQQIDGGRSWRYMITNLMPRLRKATWQCVYEREAVQALIAPQAPAQLLDTYTAPVELLRPAPRAIPLEKTTILALKTNLLYDAVTALNFEVEVPIGDRFSIMAEDVFPWWTAGPHDRQYAFQLLSIGVEPRWWFYKNDKRDRLAGHFAGVYGMTAIFDFQNDYEICYQGSYWSVGLTYGYSLPVGKLINIEFSLSLGVLQADYQHYQPSEDYEHLWLDRYKTGKLTYFGPTKLKVSLSIPIKIQKQARK